MDAQEKGPLWQATPSSQSYQGIPRIVPAATGNSLDDGGQGATAQAAQQVSPTTGIEGNTISAPAPTLPPTLEALRHVPCWLLWLYSTERNSNGKLKKIPYYANHVPRSESFLSPNDLSQLATFDEAIAAAHARPSRYVGIGIVSGFELSGGYVIQGLDFDNMPADKVQSAPALMKGYVEVTPSGAGLRAIGVGRKFNTLTNQGTNLEAYCNGHFLTVTFQTSKDDGVTDLYDYVAEVVAPMHAQLKGAKQGPAGGEEEAVDAKTVTELRSALLHMRADDYDIWYRMGLALKTIGDTGRGLWLDWSATSAKFKAGEAAKKWDGFNPTNTSYRAVFKAAQDAGWINPNSNEARGAGTGAAVPEDEPTNLDTLVVDLEADEDVEVPDIVEDLIADEDVTLIGGHGGGGKSFLAIQTACAVAMGKPVLGKKTRRCRVLFYAAEDGKKRLLRRVRKIAKVEGYDLGELKWWLMVIDASDIDPLYGERLETSKDGKHSFKKVGTLRGYDRLQEMVASFDPQLLIVDGASDTFDGNEIARRDVRGFVKALRRIHPERPIGILLSAHIDRSSARGNVTTDDGYAGSAAWHNSCRRRLYLQVIYDRDERDSDGRPVVLGTTLRTMKNQDGPPAPDLDVERDENGFWRLTAQHADNLDANGYKKPEALINEELSCTLLNIIESYYERGNWMSTSLAPNSTTNAAAVLASCDELPAALKGKKGKAKLLGMVRRLNHEGWLVAEPYASGNRHKGERWKVDRNRGGHVG